MLSIILPTYNEQQVVKQLVYEIRAALCDAKINYEMVFVDDSTDDTPIILHELSKLYNNIIVCHRMGKNGLASAIVHGFEIAQGNVLAVMDTDLQHPPQLLPKMYKIIMDGADIVIPSRYLSGAHTQGLSTGRRLASVSAKWAAKLLLAPLRNASDPTGGFLMIRRSVIEGVRLKPIGWRIQMEILAMGSYTNVVEIPYTFQKRYAGASKMNVKSTLQYFLHIFVLMIRGKRKKGEPRKWSVEKM